MEFLRNLIEQKMKQKDPNNYTGSMEDNRQMISPRTGQPIPTLNMEENQDNPEYFQKLKLLMGR